MRPVHQTILNHNPEKGIFGNCLQACIASLFELPLERVPHFALELESEWRLKFLDFVYEQGYLYEGFAPTEKLKDYEGVDGYVIVAGISSRWNWHVVIYKDGKLVHDPFPNGGELIETKGFHMIKKAIKPLGYNPWRLFN